MPGQKRQPHPFITIGILVLLIAFLAFALAVHWWGWDWTGFTGGYGKITIHTPAKDTELPPVRTLWDWLQLLVVPLMLAIGGFWLNQLQKSRDERAPLQRDKTEREITADNQREAALQAYLDNMSELLLEKKLRDSAEEDERRKIGRVRTLTVLPRLDAIRKASVIQFLHESGLIDKKKCIISLNGADLRSADLSFAHPSGAVPRTVHIVAVRIHPRSHLKKIHPSDVVGLPSTNLTESHPRKADLSGTDLSGADLKLAYLSGADLSGADLSRADLSGADLGGAILSGAILSEAHLWRAYLSGADLSGAILQKAALSGAILWRAHLSGADLSGAILQKAALSGAILWRANLSGADLGGAHLSGASLQKADLSGVNLGGACLKGVIGITW